MASLREILSRKLIGLGTRLSSRTNDPEYLIREAAQEDIDLIRRASRYSLTSTIAQWALIQALKETHRAGLDGAIVECGVWKGGNLVIAGCMRKRQGDSRQIFGFDTFAGMSAPTDVDVKPGSTLDAAKKAQDLTAGEITDWCYAPIETVQKAFRDEVGTDDVVLVKGMVETTLRDPANLPDAISVLRLDTDFYESTKAELEILYPRLQSGGVLIVDDYGEWAGARRAVDEYFGTGGPWLHYVNHTVRLAIKP